MRKLLSTIVRRLAVGLGLGLVVSVGGLAIPFVVLFGRRGYAGETASAASCMLNTFTGGPRHSTFSAYTAYRREIGKKGAASLERMVDFVNGEPNHCQLALDYHRKRGWLPRT